MLRLKKQERGVAGIIELIMIVIVIAVIGLVAWRIWDNRKSKSVTFGVKDLSSLNTNSARYEAWLVRGSTNYSLGAFNPGSDNKIDTYKKSNHKSSNIELPKNVKVKNGDKVIITIEEANHNNDTPSSTVVMEGTVTDKTANLDFKAVDFSTFSGSYILATPTDKIDTNETSGIWFMNPADSTASLNLPTAPDGWIYEGWAVHNGTPISTGVFRTATGADLKAAYSGTEAAPAFPGEDFLVNLPAGLTAPLNLANGTSRVVVSLEPYTSNKDITGNGPYQLKPLSGDIAKDLAAKTSASLSNDSTSNRDNSPSGTFTFK